MVLIGGATSLASSAQWLPAFGVSPTTDNAFVWIACARRGSRGVSDRA